MNVIERIKKDFIPVALKAGLVNNPPNNLEGRLYRDIARSKPAPQGICVVNSAGKVLSWALMFDNKKSVLGFLEHCQKRYKQFPDAKERFAAQRYMKFPSRRLPDVADRGEVIPIPKDASVRIVRVPEKGTLVGLVVGRALDKKGKPVADTVKQEHYLEARFEIPAPIQEQFVQALNGAGSKKFRLPQAMAMALVSHAYLGQLDVSPLGGRRIGGKVDRREWDLWAQRIPGKNGKATRVYLYGNSNVAGSQADFAGRRDGRRWKHEVKLKWQGYIDVSGKRIGKLMLTARGQEKLQWGRRGLKASREDLVSHLPAGHAIDLKCGVVYGLKARPSAPDRSDKRYKGHTLKEWSKKLYSSDKKTKFEAVRVLAKIGKPAIPILIKAFKDKNEKNAKQVVFAFLDLGAEAVPILLELLHDENREFRSFAILGLGRIGPNAKRAIPDLVRLIEKEGSLPAESLIKIGPAAAHALVKALKHKNAFVRSIAAGALGEIGPNAKDVSVKPLGLALNDKGRNVAFRASFALAELGPAAKEAMPQIVNALKHDEYVVRIFAAKALAKMGADAKSAVPKMALLLKDKKVNVRQHVAVALGSMGPIAKAALPQLSEVLQRDPDPTARNLAAKAILAIEGL